MDGEEKSESWGSGAGRQFNMSIVSSVEFRQPISQV